MTSNCILPYVIRLKIDCNQRLFDVLMSMLITNIRMEGMPAPLIRHYGIMGIWYFIPVYPIYYIELPQVALYLSVHFIVNNN